VDFISAICRELSSFESPLFQTNHLPDLTNVNVLLETTDVIPALLQAPPDLIATFAGMRRVDEERESIDKNAISFLFLNKA
jgi:hypothetical protein